MDNKIILKCKEMITIKVKIVGKYRERSEIRIGMGHMDRPMSNVWIYVRITRLCTLSKPHICFV